MKHLILAIVLLWALSLGLTQPARAQDANAAAVVMSTLAHHAQEGVEAAGANDLAVMQRESIELHATWAAIEDTVREADPGLYEEIEASLRSMDAALKATPFQPAVASGAFGHLIVEANEGVEHLSMSVKSASAANSGATLGQFQTTLGTALAAVKKRDERETEAAVLAAIGIWPAVEGTVAAKSPDAYTAIEAELAKASAALRIKPVDWDAAAVAVVAMQSALMAVAEQQSYTMFDSAAIVLREGLEALLVVAALLALLRRSNNQNQQGWIWGGAVMGVLLSIGAAFVLQAVFSQVSAGQNREMIEGITSLAAAALLIYVSYWLHSKASLHGWQRYINNSTAKAVARGNLIGLGLLALLAVFREGAETTVFYLGMAPSITTSDLFFGIGLGVALLMVAAWLMLVAGVRLPLRLFFRVAGILVFYLGFKFIGTGIHSLQVAGVVPATPILYLQPIPVLGIYPTWETLIPQLLMVAFAIAMAFYLQAQDRRMKVTPATTVA